MEPSDPPQPRVNRAVYEQELQRLQIELAVMLDWVRSTGTRIAAVFEGRDAAGKGGAIKRIQERLNPRFCRIAALQAPTERERTQWYFQRYVPLLPAAGEMVLFDRSWYNRAGVEKVMGFCTPDEHRRFLRQCPQFEEMLVEDGIILLKYWFSVSDEEQERRFAARLDDPDPALEAQLAGSRLAQPVRRLLAGEGRDVRPHRHGRGAVVRGRGRPQAQRAAELHRAPPLAGALRAPRGREAGLPPRQADEGYVRPDRSTMRYVPDHTLTLATRR